LPSPRWRPLVERFWLLEGESSGAPDAILPDGRVELVFHYGGPFWRHRPDGETVRQPSSLLVGQMIEPVLIASSGVAGVAAIRLRPSASRALLRFPLADVSGRFVDLELIFPSVRALRTRLAEASGDLDRIAALEDWLQSCTPSAPRPAVDAAVATIVRRSGQVTIESLTDLTGLSGRQLERRFRDDVGLPPKIFARIVRLQAALQRVREGMPLSDVAAACGFYDQAHMTRDFRQLAAISPGVWQTYDGDLAPLFINASSSAAAPASG
jgi:AraC-like DNA-binding protein